MTRRESVSAALPSRMSQLFSLIERIEIDHQLKMSLNDGQRRSFWKSDPLRGHRGLLYQIPYEVIQDIYEQVRPYMARPPPYAVVKSVLALRLRVSQPQLDRQITENQERCRYTSPEVTAYAMCLANGITEDELWIDALYGQSGHQSTVP